MTAATLLSELHRQGRTISVAGSKIRIAPKLTDDTLVEKLRAHKTEILALLKREGETARIAALDAERNAADKTAGRGYDNDPTAPSYTGPAKSLVRTCIEYGVALRLEADGTVVVGPGAWRTLADAIEQHVDTVARLLQEGWVYDA